MDNESGKPITVSRADLRADLAEMELRLRIYFDDQLKHKADIAQVIEHGLLLDRLGRGEFTAAQTNSIEAIIAGTLTERTDRGWTTRERWFGILTIFVALGSFLLAILVATHGWSGA